MRQPRVLLVSNNFSPNIGGIETHLDDLVKELLKRNISVFVLTHKPLMTKKPARFLYTDGSLTVVRIPWFRNLFYRTLGHPVLAFMYLTPALLLAMPFVLVGRRFDVIHAHSLSSAFAAAIWSRLFGTRLVVTLHARYAIQEGTHFYRVAKFVLNQADEVLCLSEKAVQDIRKLHLEKVKISRFTNWVDLEKFKPLPKQSSRKQLGLPANEFIVMFAGRLVPEKGIPELLDAAKLVNPGILIEIAGDGPLEVDIRKAQVNEPVRYLGKLSNSELPLPLSAADVFINPPRHIETFARVNLEALACGKPIIGPNRGEVTEILDDSVSVQVEITPSAIANAINELAKDPTRAASMARNARDFAERYYSSSHIEPILNAYALKTS